MFVCAVRIKESTAQINNGLTVPAHGQAGLRLHNGNRTGLQIFLSCQSEKGIRVLRLDHYGHALLRFADGKLGSVQALVLTGYSVEINIKAVGKLADGHGYAACAEVVAALDHAACVCVAEKALELALLGSVALFYFGTAGLDRVRIMRLGRTGGAADAITTGAAAEEDHNIPR